MTEQEKSTYKALLTKAGEAVEEPWHSQQSHKAAVCMSFLDLVGVKDKEQRNKIRDSWMKSTPSSFGCNASALAQACGRPTMAQKIESAMKDF